MQLAVNTVLLCADNPPDSTWAAARPHHIPSRLTGPLKVHNQQLHAHCHLQDGLLLLLLASSLWHALVRHHQA